MLLSLNGAYDRQALELLRFMHTIDDNAFMFPLGFSADGVLRFASLIADELIKISQSTTTGEVTYLLELTVRGKLLIEAWHAENDDKIKAFIEASSLTPR